MEDFREQLRVGGERAILVGATHRAESGKGWAKTDDLAELACLVESAGAKVVDKFIQKVYKINASTYIGSGKAKMLYDRVERFEADVIVFDNDLSPGQIRELEKIIEAKVIDRSELILDIFASRAQTRQAKLQVELAQLEYTYPRLTRMWSHLDRLAGGSASGGVGTRGTGEKQLEIDKRLVTRRVTDLKRELAGIDKRKLREIDGRNNIFKASLVGYTNSGKSTLMNALTDAGVYVQDQLFATLDTRTKKWGLERGSEVLLSDTVGFVSNLPHQLVASFKATLEEAVNADLLLHIVDVANEEVFEQVESVDKVLKEIDCADKDMIIVLNKTDAIKSKKNLESLQTIYPDAVSISAKNGLGLEELREVVLSRYRGGDVLLRIKCQMANGKVQSYLRSRSQIISEDYVDNYVVIEARLGTSLLGELRSLKPDEIEELDSCR